MHYLNLCTFFAGGYYVEVREFNHSSVTDLHIAVMVCSPFPGLYIPVAFTMNITAVLGFDPGTSHTAVRPGQCDMHI